MGLVKTRRLAAMRTHQRAMAVIGSVASSNVASFQLGIGSAKLSNGMLPNYRTDSRQTTERFHAKLPNGYCVA